MRLMLVIVLVVRVYWVMVINREGFNMLRNCCMKRPAFSCMHDVAKLRLFLGYGTFRLQF